MSKIRRTTLSTTYVISIFIGNLVYDISKEWFVTELVESKYAEAAYKASRAIIINDTCRRQIFTELSAGRLPQSLESIPERCSEIHISLNNNE